MCETRRKFAYTNTNACVDARVCLCVGNSRLLPIFFPNFGCFALVAWFAPIQRGSSGTWRTAGGGGGGPLWRSTGVVPLEDQHHRTHQSPGASPPPVPLVCSTPNLHTHTSEASFVKQKKTRSRSLAGQVIDLGEYNDLRGSAFLGPTVPNPEPYESLPARHKRPNPICFPTRQALPGLPGDLLRVTSISTQKVLPLVPTPAALNSTSDSSTGHKSGTGDPQKRRQP